MDTGKKTLNRYILSQVKKDLTYQKSVLILGPRQVGKSTLIKNLLSQDYHFDSILLQNPENRIRFEQDPSRLIKDYEVEGTNNLIYLDEVQKVPELFDSIQYLIEEKKKIFILTGSSARKLRRKQVNLLPGRIILSHLDPLMWGEMGMLKGAFIPELKMENINPREDYTFEDCLIYGSLPEMVMTIEEERKRILKSYAVVYLEEEIRAEALSRNIGGFKSFLQLAGFESGKNPNYSKLSNQTGISLLTIKEYFQILEDTLIIEKLPPYIKNPRKRIVTSSKYYFFDIGVRNAVMEAPLEKELINVNRGLLFEHFVLLELFRRKKIMGERIKFYYWRTQSGLEVDLVVEYGEKIIPIEIKATTEVRLEDLSGLIAFMKEYMVKEGYVITMDKKPQQISPQITAVPWNYI